MYDISEELTVILITIS